MKSIGWKFVVSMVAVIAVAPVAAQEVANPYLGRWALTIPSGGAGWLGVTQENGYLDASILWGGGSVVPVASVYLDGDSLVVTRSHSVERKDGSGKIVKRHTFTETITATISGDTLNLVTSRPRNDGLGVSRDAFTGSRIPDLLPAPDLSKVKYGAPQDLLASGLDGWKLINDKRADGWTFDAGILINAPVQEKGKPHISYGNLRTINEYEDFNLKLGVNAAEGSNSGVYLRGIYEVQVLESYGKEPDTHHMGAIYSRIRPLVAAERKPGEWQTLDITLVDRHVTVKLNGTRIIDNQPLFGCTGGALWSDESRPGPIYLQGDHSAVRFRDMVLTPVLK
jgi:hypothetical protein